MNDLPHELVLKIIDFLNPKQIVLLSRTCRNFNKLNIGDSIIEHNIKSFPRSGGKAKIFEVYHCSLRFYNFDYNDTIAQISQAIYYYYNNEIDIVKGDIFIFDDYNKTGPYEPVKTIFDGGQLIMLNYDDKDLLLPSLFHVIENNVPLQYWNLKFNYFGIKRKMDNIIWFNHNLVRQQCLDNLSKMSESSISFIFNDIEYQIIINSNDQNVKELFTDKLLSNDLIKFYYKDDEYILYTKL